MDIYYLTSAPFLDEPKALAKTKQQQKTKTKEHGSMGG